VRSGWYTRLSRRDRRLVDATAKWLRPVRWQWFVTLTFPWNVRSETADRKLRELINLLERHHREVISFVAGKESRSRIGSSRIPWHFHLIVTSRVTVSKEALECYWLGLIRYGGGMDTRLTEHALVEPYHAHERGPEYCLKAVNDCAGEWVLHGLECCLPRVCGPAKPNHGTVRRQRRAAVRAVDNAGPGS